MSQHEIEDLIETSVRTVDSSALDATQKRNALVNLYRVQAGFDCSYTHFRCIDILLRLRAAYRIPLSEHPDFDTAPEHFQAPDNNWLPADAQNPDASVVFYQSDDNHLYFDAGDDFWHRLQAAGAHVDDEPASWSTAATVGCMLELAATAGDAELFSEWLGFASNVLLIDDGASFPAWLNDPEMRAIHATVGHNPTLLRPESGYRETRLEPLKKLLGYRQKHELDARYKLHFLLDAGSDPEQLLQRYKQDLGAQGFGSDEIIRSTLADYGWHCLETLQEKDRVDLLFIPSALETYNLEDPTTVLPVLQVNVSLELKTISAGLGLKYALMMKWQAADSWQALAQLKTDVNSQELSTMLTDEERSANKHLHKTYVGWKLKPEKQLGQRVLDLAAQIPDKLSAFLAQYSYAWFNDYLNKDPRPADEDEPFNKLPGKFLIRWHMVLLHAFILYEQGDKDEAKIWAKRFLDYIAPASETFDLEPYARSAHSILNDAPLLQRLY